MHQTDARFERQAETRPLRMDHRLHIRPRISSLLVISIATLTTHWMALLNEGLVAEDWGLFPALVFKDWPAITDMFSSAGVPAFSLYVWLMAFAGNIFLYKAILFFALYFIALLAYFIGLRSGYLTEPECVLFAIFSQALPIPTVTTLFTYSIYFYPVVLFLLATYLFLMMETIRGIRRSIIRGVSLCLYFLAFTLNSLLVLYLGAFVLVYLVRLRITGRRERHFRGIAETLGQFCRTRPDFVALPFLYWAWKKAFTPTKGLYGSYNAFDFEPKHILRSAYHFLADGLVIPLGKSFGPTNPYILLAVAICSVPCVWILCKYALRNERSADQRANDRDAWPLIGFGVMLLLCGTVPYILVGKSPSPGVLMRNAVLIPLPLSLIILGAWRALRTTKAMGMAADKVAATVLLILLVLFQARWWENYAAWQARTAKGLAITQYLAENPNWKDFAVYWIDDGFTLTGSDEEYSFQEFTARFRLLWGGQSRMAFTPGHQAFFGIDSPRGERPVHSKFPERLAYFCNDWSSAKDIDLAGAQAELQITPGLATWTNEAIAFEFLYLRFIRPQDLHNYLNRLLTVDLRAL